MWDLVGSGWLSTKEKSIEKSIRKKSGKCFCVNLLVDLTTDYSKYWKVNKEYGGVDGCNVWGTVCITWIWWALEYRNHSIELPLGNAPVLHFWCKKLLVREMTEQRYSISVKIQFKVLLREFSSREIYGCCVCNVHSFRRTYIPNQEIKERRQVSHRTKSFKGSLNWLHQVDRDF